MFCAFFVLVEGRRKGNIVADPLVFSPGVC